MEQLFRLLRWIGKDVDMNREKYTTGRWISILYRYGQSYVGRKLEGYNIGSGQYGILLNLHRKGGISQEELANYLKTDKGSIAKSVKKLEDEGYIERSPDADDKRAYKVFLTQKAKDVIPVLEEAIGSWEDTLVSGLSDGERLLVEQLLYKMAKNACNHKANDQEDIK